MREPSRLIFESRLFRLGEFHLEPGDPRWRRENCIGRGAHVVFPGTAVRIAHSGSPALVADANQVVFYRDRQTYRRQVVDTRGDHCIFIVPAPHLLADAAEAAGGASSLPFTHGPVDAASYLRQRVVAHHAACSPDPDPLLVEEELTRVIAAVVAAAFQADGAAPNRRPIRSDPVDAAQATLATRYPQRMSLDELAREVHVSPFHLARRFRARTGLGLHAYRTHLRLRAALERIADPALSLTELALDLGFASHSHFTDSFRRTFGRPPSEVRAAVRARGSGEARRILEAVPAAGS